MLGIRVLRGVLDKNVAERKVYLISIAEGQRTADGDRHSFLYR
jgi:hypothetical protein